MSDAVAVLDCVGVERAHLVHLSMGGFCAPHLASLIPRRVTSAVVAGCGYGSPPAVQAQFRRECEAIATAFTELGAAAVAGTYAAGPVRVQLQNRNPDPWELFRAQRR